MTQDDTQKTTGQLGAIGDKIVRLFRKDNYYSVQIKDSDGAPQVEPNRCKYTGYQKSQFNPKELKIGEIGIDDFIVFVEKILRHVEALIVLYRGDVNLQCLPHLIEEPSFLSTSGLSLHQSLESIRIRINVVIKSLREAQAKMYNYSLQLDARSRQPGDIAAIGRTIITKIQHSIDVLGEVGIVSESPTTIKGHKIQEKEFTGLTIPTPDGTTWGDVEFVVHDEWASISVMGKIRKPKVAFNELGFRSNIKTEDGRITPGYLWGFFRDTVAMSAGEGYPRLDRSIKSQVGDYSAELRNPPKTLVRYTSLLRTLLKNIFPNIPYSPNPKSKDAPIPYDFNLRKWMPQFGCKRDTGMQSKSFHDWE